MKAMMFSLALLLPGAAFAQVTGAVERSVVEGATELNQNTRVICRVIGETGSRLSRSRVCMTQARWAEHDRLSRQMVADAQNRQLAPNCMTGGQAAAALRGMPGPH